MLGNTSLMRTTCAGALVKMNIRSKLGFPAVWRAKAMLWRDAAHLRHASVIRKPHQYSLWDTFNNCEKEEQQDMWKFDDNLEQFAEPRSGIHFKLGDSGGSGSSPYTCWAVTDYVCGTLKTKPNRTEPSRAASFRHHALSHVMQKFLFKITRCLQRLA